MEEEEPQAAAAAAATPASGEAAEEKASGEAAEQSPAADQAGAEEAVEEAAAAEGGAEGGGQAWDGWSGGDGGWSGAAWDEGNAEGAWGGGDAQEASDYGATGKGAADDSEAAAGASAEGEPGEPPASKPDPPRLPPGLEEERVIPPFEQMAEEADAAAAAEDAEVEAPPPLVGNGTTTLTQDEAWRLTTEPDVRSLLTDAQVKSPQQRIATVSGARVDIEGTTLTIFSEDERQARLAAKYLRLIRSASMEWVKLAAEDYDDGDLTVFEVPKEVQSSVLGRQGNNFKSVEEDTCTMLFLIDEGQQQSSWDKQQQPKPSCPWLAVGRPVEVKKRGGDIRSQSWVAGNVTEIMRSGSVRVHLPESKATYMYDLESLRPRYEIGEPVDVHSEGEWKIGKIQERLEDGKMSVLLDSGEAVEVESGVLRLHEEPEEPKPQEEPEVPSEPMIKVAIFGELRCRCAAQLSLMRALDKRRPGFFENKMPGGWDSMEDWSVQVVEIEQDNLGRCIGKKGSMQKKLSRATTCTFEYLGTMAYICGRPDNCRFGVALLETLRNSEKGTASSVPDDAIASCETLTVPHSMVGGNSGRSWMGPIEEQEGVITFLAPEEEEPSPAEEAPPKEGDAEAEAGGGEAEAGTDQEWWNKDNHTWKEPQPRKFFIFAFDARTRKVAALRMMAAVDAQLTDHFASQHSQKLSGEEGCTTDVVKLEGDEAERLTATQRSLVQAATGCSIELIGSLLFFVGDGTQRARAREYLKFIRDSCVGEALAGCDFSRQIRIAASAMESRSDVTILKLQAGEDKLLDEVAIQAAEKGTDCMLLLRQPMAAEVMHAGAQLQVIRGGVTFAARVEEVQGAGEPVTLRIVLDGSAAAEDENPVVPDLLIFGHDAGPNGFAGRSEALRRVRRHLANPPYHQAGEESWQDAQNWQQDSGAANSWKQDATNGWDQREDWKREDNRGGGGKKDSGHGGGGDGLWDNWAPSASHKSGSGGGGQDRWGQNADSGDKWGQSSSKSAGAGGGAGSWDKWNSGGAGGNAGGGQDDWAQNGSGGGGRGGGCGAWDNWGGRNNSNHTAARGVSQRDAWSAAETQAPVSSWDKWNAGRSTGGACAGGNKFADAGASAQWGGSAGGAWGGGHDGGGGDRGAARSW